MKAIVIGAGPAGLATALHLHKTHNTQVTVYEIRTAPTTLGGAISIPANGLRLLDRLGVYKDIRAGGSITPEIIFHSTHGGLLGRLDLVSGIRQRTGYEYMRVKRTVLMDAMLKAVEAAGSGIEVRFGEKVVAITENHDNDDDDGGESVTARFESGHVDTADLLVGCDGIHSAVRSLYVDPDGAPPEYSGVASMSSIVQMDTELEGLNFTLTARGSMAVLPCVDTPGTTTNTAAAAASKELFWFITRHIPAPSNAADARDGWTEHGKKEVDGFKDTARTFIQDVQGDWGSFLRQVILSTHSVNFYPIYRLPRDDDNSRPWHRGRCVLVGDAAHAMSPHVGQGVSMALEDVFLLVRALGSVNSSSSLEDMLGRFECIRKPRVAKMAEKAASNARASKVKGPWEMMVTEWLLWAWSWKSWFFKALFLGLEEDDVAYDIDEVDLY